MSGDDLSRWERLAHAGAAKRALAVNSRDAELEERRRAARRVSDTERAVAVAQQVASAVQAQAHKQISEVVSRCLSAVFEEPYQFKIDFERKRGRTEAKITFVKDGKNFHPSLGAGIGVTDVAAFGLRVACLLMQRPRPARIIVGDEPFKNLNGKRLQKRASAALRMLAEQFDFQFIFVCGDGEEWLKEAGEVIQL